MNRRDFMGAVPAAALLAQTGIAKALPGKKGVMLMNRIGPSASELYIADADGSNERKLLGPQSRFEYHAVFGHGGDWIAFTSERNGDGNSDLYRSRLDGSDLRRIIATPAMEDAVTLSPDGRRAAYVSTADGFKTNIWVIDLDTGRTRNLTAAKGITGNPKDPDGYFRPSWSPDGEWLAFSSDRNTPWRGHDEGHGWEHTQELSIYLIRPDGTGFRKLASKEGYCLGSPKWSPDGKRIVYYEITTEGTWGAHRPEWIGRVGSQIVSVDVATGGDRVEHTSGPGLKLFPQYVSADNIGYLVKGGPDTGLAFTKSGVAAVKRNIRSPTWSPDGRYVVYEKVGFAPRPQDKPLYSWDPDWEYRSTDVFPVLSRKGRLAVTQKQLGNSSIVTMKPDGTDQRIVFDTDGKGLDPKLVKMGLAGAFQPAWSPDEQWIAFGVGVWFQERAHGKATIMRTRADGSTPAEALTDGTVHSGFPSYSGDGRHIVYRVWGDGNFGLRVIDLDDRSVRVLTTAVDNLPFWSPDGRSIVFTRKTSPTNFDICTIRPDGTGLKTLTTSEANDGHAVWTHDGRILWSTGMFGFRDEAAIYDNTFQPYGQIMLMNADGSGKRLMTDSLWEDSMPLFIPNEFL